MASNIPWMTRLVRMNCFAKQRIYPIAISIFQDGNLTLNHVVQQQRTYDVKNDSTDHGENFSISPPKIENKPTTKTITISRAMKAYMERAKSHDNMMKAEVADYEIGKRHLANIMGEDPDNFTQADVDRAIEYLLPSGLFDKKARPLLKNPYEIFPKRKVAQFSLDGRPLHWLYFTALPNFYSILHDITCKMEDLKALEDKLLSENKTEDLNVPPLNLASSEWLTYQQLKDKFVEKVQEKDYQHFLVMMERLVSHPLSHRELPFIMAFRNMLTNESLDTNPPQIEYDAEGRSFSCAEGTRKDSWAYVKLYMPGTGKVTINGKDLSYFTNFLYRESLLFPLSLAGVIGQVDIEAEAMYGGPTGHCGAIRLAVSRALCAFVDKDVKEKLRLTGMLTRDPRKRERKKPGQEGARKKFTWKKR
ncbi:unnamed protein product [Lymnaea stagnalis]|uniref:28S ribosomal protein S9, mitochondrial n=1 Tax=Lymnaea stagnalis TaxID=6523 RepID=A0AAV2IE63_LYMST